MGPAREIPPRVHHHDGYPVTFWCYAPSRGDHASASARARGLHALHEALAGLRHSTDWPLPSVRDELATIRHELRRAGLVSALGASDRRLLTECLDRGLAELAETPQAARILHGSPHDANVLSVDGRPLFIDFAMPRCTVTANPFGADGSSPTDRPQQSDPAHRARQRAKTPNHPRGGKRPIGRHAAPAAYSAHACTFGRRRACTIAHTTPSGRTGLRAARCCRHRDAGLRCLNAVLIAHGRGSSRTLKRSRRDRVPRGERQSASAGAGPASRRGLTG